MTDRIKILEKALEMAEHNLYCYSKNYLMTEPKPKYEKEWQEANDESNILREWIKELKGE
jgi:hypothetical protein